MTRAALLRHYGVKIIAALWAAGVSVLHAQPQGMGTRMTPGQVRISPPGAGKLTLMGYSKNDAGYYLWHDVTTGDGLVVAQTPLGFVVSAAAAQVQKPVQYQYVQMLRAATPQSDGTFTVDIPAGVEVMGTAVVYRNGLVQESLLGVTAPGGSDYALSPWPGIGGGRYVITPNITVGRWGDGDKIKMLTLERTEI